MKKAEQQLAATVRWLMMRGGIRALSPRYLCHIMKMINIMPEETNKPITLGLLHE